MTETPSVHDYETSTYVAVTPRNDAGRKEGGKEGGEGSRQEVSTSARARVRARDRMLSATGVVTQGVRLRGMSRRVKTSDEAAAPDITETTSGGPRHFWHDGPAPASDVAAYTRSGAWLRGQRNPLLEWAGKVWGYGIALPLTLFLGALIWCTHRFHRAVALAFIVAVLWVSAPTWGQSEQVPAAPQIGAAP